MLTSQNCEVNISYKVKIPNIPPQVEIKFKIINRNEWLRT